MSTFTLSKQTTGDYLVEGELTFFNLNKKNITSLDFFKSAKEICIDLAKVTSADSAGLALLIEWIKQCRIADTKLTFKNIPQQLLTLAKLGGFEIDQYIH